LRKQNQRINDDGQFNSSVEGANELPFPPDLLGALKSEKLWNDIQPGSVPPPNNFDIIAALLRQLKFAQAMHNAKWLRGEFSSEILKKAISRYDMFFTLLEENPGKALSPTQDIDLVWHTHQVSPKRYRSYSTTKTKGIFVRHGDTVDKPGLEDSFDAAETLFRTRFGGAYNMCFCEPCMMRTRVADGEFDPVHLGNSPSKCRARCSSAGCSSNCSNGGGGGSCSSGGGGGGGGGCSGGGG
jgi:uncharacterized membrane protein YgcG